MAHDKVYGFCEAKCKVEVPDKVTFDEYIPKDGTAGQVWTSDGNGAGKWTDPVKMFIIDKQVDTDMTVKPTSSCTASTRKLSRPTEQVTAPIFNPDSQTLVMPNYHSDYEETTSSSSYGYQTAIIQYSSETLEPLIRSAIHVNVDCTFTLHYTLENTIFSAVREVEVTVVNGEVSLGEITVTTRFYGNNSTTYNLYMYFWATDVVFT